MLEYLKVKLNALAAEAKIIRNKERHFLGKGRNLKGIFSRKHQKDDVSPQVPEKTIATLNWAKENTQAADDAEKYNYDMYWNLHHHRVEVVRREARNSNIAYGFLRGLKYSDIEHSKHTHPDWDKIQSMVERFNSTEDMRILKQRFAEWLEDAKQMPLIQQEQAIV